MVPQFIMCVQAWLNLSVVYLLYIASSIACCNFIVFHFEFLYFFGLSTNWSLRPQEARSFVRPSVRPSVTLFLGNRSFFILKLCSQLWPVSLTKKFQALFLKNSCFAHFGQKLSKIGHFTQKWRFLHFIAILLLLFGNFLC